MPSTKEWALLHEDLLRILHYSPETGVWTWQIDPSPQIMAGERAGTLSAHGYIQISINTIKYMSHRMAIFYMTKRWPAAWVDHINGDKSDNRWENLREATRTENGRNRPKQVNNTSGYKGASFHKRIGKFSSTIRVSGKKKHLGYFDTAEEASAAYEAKAREVSGEFYPDKLN